MLVRMTRGEMEFLKTVKTADEIWYRLWTSKKNSKSRQSEYYRAKKKLQTLIDGVKTPKGCFSFSSLLHEIAPRWEEPEWGFPKGRRVPKESDIDCALREFQEETDIARENIHVLPIKPVEETFIGSNNVKYKHIYFLAYCDEEIQLRVNPKNKHQKAEVSAISWLPAHDLIEKIRGNNQERKKIVVHVTNYFHSIMSSTSQSTSSTSTPSAEDDSTSTPSAEDVETSNDKNEKEPEV
jgi:ADP-ribose pyrophosphatase YjhB (NUDIX family)